MPLQRSHQRAWTSKESKKGARSENYFARSALRVTLQRYAPAVPRGVSMTKPGWGVVVQGEATDLQGWADNLKELFDPWVEIHWGETVLRSALLDGLASANAVSDRALAYIDRINGAMALWQQAGPLRFGKRVIQFTADGKQHRTMFPQTASVEIRGSNAMRADTIHLGPDGKPVPPPPPQPSEVQRWAAIAEGDDWLDDGLIYFGKADDWFAIYKSLECLIERSGGGKERAFLDLNWEPEAEVKRLKQTANWARHARRIFDPPPNPMTLKDARVLLGRLLQRALRGHP